MTATSPSARRKYQPIADWRFYDNYPPLTCRHGARLAWEFLRRNSAYQSNYASYLAVRSMIEALDPAYKLSLYRDAQRTLDLWSCSPSAKPGETLGSYRARNPRGVCVRWDRLFKRRWSLAAPADPRHAYSAEKVRFTTPERLYLGRSEGRLRPKRFSTILRPGEALLRVDLRADYLAQLELLKEKLAPYARKEQQRAYPSGFKLAPEFHLMLRYFDARVAFLGDHGLPVHVADVSHSRRPERSHRKHKKQRFPLSAFRGGLLSDEKLQAAIETSGSVDYEKVVSGLESNRTAEWDRYLVRIIFRRGHLALANKQSL